MLLTKQYKRDIINKSHQKTEVFESQTIKKFEKIFKKVLTNGWRCDKILKLSKDGGIKFPSGARKFNAVFKRKREARAWRIRGTLKIEQQTRTN